MSEVGEGMLVDAVDPNDVPVGVVQRSQVFSRKANFRVAHILVFDAKGDLLLQQLSPSRLRHPGYWGSSVAAYVFAGESYEAAAQRRLGEELQIHQARLWRIGKTSMIDEGCQKFITVFKTLRDGPLRFDRTHIERLEFVPMEEVHRLSASGIRTFTPTFLRVLSFYESRI